MTQLQVHQSSLCARGTAIHITEGQIPAVCGICDPPRAFVPERTFYDYDEGVTAPDGSGWSP